MKLSCSFYLLIHTTLLFAFAYPQQPEINDQYESTISTNTITINTNATNEVPAKDIAAVETAKPTAETTVTEPPTIQNDTNEPTTRLPERQSTEIRRVAYITRRPNCIEKIYESISTTLDSFITTPKINTVLKNIGVCIVNGIMEIITFYVPAPFIPLIASAAGMLIPFEPVVMLREKLPMRNYRRAVNSAVNSFLGTFDRFAVHDDDDPYMMRRFNRRFMGASHEELSTKRNGDES